ncbi:hypothetical protein ACHAXT_010515 [Thalassiosira profunda]
MNSTFVNLFVSFATLLPGDPADCPDPTNVTDASCAGGLASVASVIRHSQRRGDGPALHIPKLDRVSKFVQMHPEGWGVNRLISHDRFGWPAYFTSPSLFSETGGRDVSLLRTHDFTPIMTNVDLSPSSPWSPYLQGVYFDEGTGLAQIHIRDDTQPMAAEAVSSLEAALDYVAETNERAGCFENGEGHATTFDAEEGHDSDEGHSQWSHLTAQCWSAVVLFNEPNQDQYKACLEAALQHPHPPLVFYDMDENDARYATPKIVNDRTVVFHLPDSTDAVSHLRLEVGGYDSGGRRTIQSMEYTAQALDGLPMELKDEDYVADLKYLRTLADQALENDPIVGTSEFMPFTREGEWRKCMGGECPIGNLFTDAMAWAADADFAVASSGGLRGPGWPAGPVRVSDLFAALPFMNDLCTGVMSGVSVFKLLNYSTAVATYESTYTPMGDRLLQLSGMRMTYNTLVEGDGTGRLMAVEVWDKEEKKYLPLERLKLYTFATDSWMCGGFDPFPSLLGEELVIEGEVPGSVDLNENIQSIVGEYLTELDKPYKTSIQQRLVNDTKAFTPLDFVQTEESCSMDHFWESQTLTCKPCPGGKYVSFSDELVSFVVLDGSEGIIVGREILYNRETFDVTVAPRLSPSWFLLGSLGNSTNDASKPMVLLPGESTAIEFGIDSSQLTPGTVRSTVSWGVVIDGEYPGCLTDLDISFDVLVEVRDEEDLNQIDRIRPVGLTFMALAMALSFFFAAYTWKKKEQRVMKAGQPHFLLLICAGTFIMATSIIPLSIDDSIASVEGCSKACMSFPWLFLIGFTTTFSALTAKIWRLNRVMSNARSMSRVAVTEREAIAPILIFSVLNVALLLCWTLVDPLVWNREPIDDDPSNTYGFCASEGTASIAFITVLILLNLTALVLACVQAWRARKMDDEFTESRWLGMAIMSWIQVLVIGVPVILLTRSDPIASYFTQTALVFLVCVSMLCFIYVPKMRMMSKQSKQRESLSQIAMNSRTASLGRTVLTGMSTSELNSGREQRYQQRIRELEALLDEAQGAKTLKGSGVFFDSQRELEVNGHRKESQIADFCIDDTEETIHRLSVSKLKRMSSSGNLSI